LAVACVVLGGARLQRAASTFVSMSGALYTFPPEAYGRPVPCHPRLGIRNGIHSSIGIVLRSD
jgi:hypothetical protein